MRSDGDDQTAQGVGGQRAPFEQTAGGPFMERGCSQAPLDLCTAT